MIQKHEFVSPNNGPKLIVLGAVHGNEPKGTEAIMRICSDLETGRLLLLRGAVTFVPIANPEAYQANKRFLEEDLNRVFRKTEAPASYEAHIANELTTLVDQADVLLDMHTTSAPGPSCVFIDYPTDANKALASVVGAKYALLNWPELYEGDKNFDSFDTTRYAYEAGKDGIIVETGQHEEPEAADRAYEVILRVLHHLGSTAEAPSILDTGFTPIRMTALYQKKHEDDRFMERWDHLEPIPKDTVIAVRADGTEISVSVDSVMLLPKHHALAGEEWFYVGEII